MSEQEKTTKKRRVSAAERAIEIAEKRAREKLITALAQWTPYRRALFELTGGTLDDLGAAEELVERLHARDAAEAEAEEPQVVT